MQIAEDPLSQLAAANWASPSGDTAKLPAFKPALVVDIYRKHLGGGSDKPPPLKRVMLLELSQYMELYLWPNFDPDKSSYEHVMSVLLLVNEKFRENVPAWGIFAADKVPTLAALRACSSLAAAWRRRCLFLTRVCSSRSG